jgi:hypothetical protein
MTAEATLALPDGADWAWEKELSNMVGVSPEVNLTHEVSYEECSGFVSNKWRTVWGEQQAINDVITVRQSAAREKWTSM